MGADDESERRSDVGAAALGESGRAFVYLAAERTLLTWIRAAIAFMVLGFAVDRFGLIVARTAGGEIRTPPGSSVALLLWLNSA